MKILLTIHHSLTLGAGAPGVTLALGEQYQRLGHDVRYFSFDNLPTWLPGRFKEVLFPLFVAFHIAALVITWDIDVVHASSVDSWIWGKYLKHLFKRKALLLVTQSHGLEHTLHFAKLEEEKHGNLHLSWKYRLYRGSILLWKAAISFRSADLSFMLNQPDAKYLKEKLHIPAEKIHVFPNAVPEEFLGLPFPEDESSSEIGIALIASYIERKGIRYSIPALTETLKKYSKVKIGFFGTGCPKNQVLEDFPSEMSNRISVIPHFDKKDLPDFLKEYQVFLFPSLSEGFPLALLEAMSCGLAPIVTDIPGPTELIIDGENGLVIPPRNQESIEESITRLIDSKSQLKRLRTKAYLDAQSYTWKRIAKQHLDLYHSEIAEQ